MVRGKKNFLLHAPLIMGFTVLFRLVSAVRVAIQLLPDPCCLWGPAPKVKACRLSTLNHLLHASR